MKALSGEGDPWRTAALILCVFIVVAVALIARRGRRTSAGMLLMFGTAALVVVGTALFQTHVASQPGSMSGMDMSAAMNGVNGNAAAPVTTATVQRAGASEEVLISAPGTLAPYLVQDVVTRAPGVLRDFSAYAGDHVHAGQVLAQLDESELNARAGASIADAQGQNAAANAADIEARNHAPNAARIAKEELSAETERQRYWSSELRRQRSLLDSGAVSRQEYEDERAQAAAADAALINARIKVNDAIANLTMTREQAAGQRSQARRAEEAARVDAVMLSYTQVLAPSSGVVLKRLVDPGTSVQSGVTIARIAVLDRLRAQANVAQQDLPFIAVDTLVDLNLNGNRLHVLHGRVTSITPVADTATHTAGVEAIVENPGSAVVPGGYIRVIFHGSVRIPSNGFRIPSAALIGGGKSGSAVWSIADGSAHRVSVKALSDDGERALVTSDALQAGDHIVLDGAASLEEGERVIERGEAMR